MLNYLSHRYQYVEYNGVQSSSQHINTGVAQGSILGPLLFLFYINDLPLVSPVFRMLMYADDSTLFCNINNDINDNPVTVSGRQTRRHSCVEVCLPPSLT